MAEVVGKQHPGDYMAVKGRVSSSSYSGTANGV